MITAATISVILFCSSGHSTLAPVTGDDPVSKVVDDIIADIDNYIDDHLLTDVGLPDLGLLPLDPVKMTEGTIGQFDTVQLVGEPSILRQNNTDGSSTYLFDLRLGLDLLLIHYHFHFKLPKVFSEDGEITLASQLSALRVKGMVVAGKGGYCDAKLDSAALVQLGDFAVDLEPDDIPFLNQITETILNFVSPKLMPAVNLALDAITLLPNTQEKFLKLVCKHFSNN